MNRVLTLKSWQTFGLIIIMPILLIVLGGVLIRITEIKALGTLFAILAALTMMISYYGWIWTAGIALFRQCVFNSKLNLNAFRFLFVLALILFLTITPILKTVFSEDSLFVIRIIGIASLLSFFYCIYFISTAIRNLERQRNIKTSFIILDFILIWILPIGIWFIQPRIDKILAYKEEKAQSNII
ncbi:MAG: hypothetical protein KG029_16220 [Bacteroidetes bacterium]|nr:hypothetical protein [Bacteroidota bacterium]